MVDEFRIDGVPKFKQIDNKYVPTAACAPTSNAMAMAYCLGLKGLTKADVGCGPDMQLEDYVNHMIDDDITRKWIVDNDKKNGGWWAGYLKKNPARQIHAIEAYVFNRLMNEHGFRAEYRALPGYDDFCAKILETKLPIIISGDFSTVSKVAGHVTCGIGFNRKGLQEVIVNDPYGYALKGYPEPHECVEARYPLKLYLKAKPVRLDTIVIMKA